MICDRIKGAACHQDDRLLGRGVQSATESMRGKSIIWRIRQDGRLVCKDLSGHSGARRSVALEMMISSLVRDSLLLRTLKQRSPFFSSVKMDWHDLRINGDHR